MRYLKHKNDELKDVYDKYTAYYGENGEETIYVIFWIGHAYISKHDFISGRNYYEKTLYYLDNNDYNSGNQKVFYHKVMISLIEVCKMQKDKESALRYTEILLNHISRSKKEDLDIIFESYTECASLYSSFNLLDKELTVWSKIHDMTK